MSDPRLMPDGSPETIPSGYTPVQRPQYVSSRGLWVVVGALVCVAVLLIVVCARRAM